MRIYIPIYILLLSLTACAGKAIEGVKFGIQTSTEFNEVVLEDVVQAKLLAEQSGDKLGLMCWTYVEQFALDNAPGTETPAGKVVGVFSAYQKARNVRRTMVEVEISDPFRLNCGPMLTESMGALGRIGIRMSIPVL